MAFVVDVIFLSSKKKKKKKKKKKIKLNKEIENIIF
jgi:hypothetical protein